MLAIVADDLTGALDTAAPFASRGLHVEVALDVGAIAAAVRENPAVLSVTLASREIDAAAARDVAAAALAALPPGTRLFKKVDSRLKGHIAEELDAVPFRSALVAPAIPAFGRVVRNGHVQGFGVETPISVAERLGRHAARARIPDTMTAQDMAAALDLAIEDGVDLLIGARGLAEALAERMAGDVAPRAAEIPAGRGLFVIGSRDPITLAQIEALRAAVDPRYLPAPNGRLPGAVRDAGAITLVQAVPGATAATGQAVSLALAESVCPALTEGASTLLLSGGATAEAVLSKMGITRFRLMGECLPGLGLAHAEGHCIIAKSGGFGGPETLKEIAEEILRRTG
ncbi:four-carbon acid sugar kinase family protein [Shinella fusca]|uniref:Uncharacterized protein YgbK (DUF1537 family) n=1 Tax=Shinella fusca TaxID=544480 RepID=A0A7W7YTK7_9HYPH|nr:four-carbon acid sugar kinase family protein [Shinella fusca]MBB5042143.1 uncharacterized protein YgbK (DUF1537 family) [Shinella fusca]